MCPKKCSNLAGTESQGEMREWGRNRKDCMRQFKSAWERFAADEINLSDPSGSASGRRNTVALPSGSGKLTFTHGSAKAAGRPIP